MIILNSKNKDKKNMQLMGNTLNPILSDSPNNLPLISQIVQSSIIPATRVMY